MNRLRVGIAGVGHIGKNHARIYSELEEANFTAVCDPSDEAAGEVELKYGAKRVSGLDEFVSLIDAASIATPTPFHFEIAKHLIENGKHVLIEKPITETTEHAKELVRLAQEKNVILQVGHVERFNPVLSALEERLTKPRFIEAHRLSPYPNRSTEIGVVLDLMIHDLEIILHLVKSPVKSIDAVGVPVLSRKEDIANVRIRFESGCIANVTASRISPERMRKIRVFQEDAYLSLDYQNQSGEMYRRADGRIIKEEVSIERDEPLKRQLGDFVACSIAGKRPKVSGSEAAAALELAIDITRAIESVDS